MFEMVQLLAGTNPFLLAFSVLIFDIPRFTLSLVSLALFGVRGRNERGAASNASVSVIIPTFNGGSGLNPSIESLHRQTLRPVEIIVVDDGSTDETRAVAERARALGLVDMVICHGTRCGRSAAINAAARFASGDLLLTVDADTVFEPPAVETLAATFSDPRVVAGASCNIAINNERDSLWAGLQSVEYLMSITAGRSILDVVDAIACLSGACSMYRRDVFMRQGGLDVGPGEDLEFSLRLRRLGHRIRFVPDAWAETAGPASGISLLRQRARWDRDGLRVRFMMYGELSFFIASSACRTRFKGWTSLSLTLSQRSACRSIWLSSCCCSAPMPLGFSRRSKCCCWVMTINPPPSSRTSERKRAPIRDP